MRRRLASALLAIPLALGIGLAAACHTTDADVTCREYKDRLNDAAGYNKWSVVSATGDGGIAARCTLRNNQTFANAVRCIRYEDHSTYIC